MTRAFILLLDSFGIGAAPDAEKFGDIGSNTLRHIAEYCFEGKANREGVRQGPLSLPNMTRLGLSVAAKECGGASIPGLEDNVVPDAAYGYASEISYGKDTPSGHWEITGVPVLFEWGYFSPDYPSFPKELLDEFIKRANILGVIGNKASSGTVILDELGEEHMKTGKPIVYTSADSVFQIAAHEETFGLDRLYELCLIARELVDPYNIGRVIARPFLGKPGDFYRTSNRRDYSVPPPAPTLLDHLVEAGCQVVGIGKIGDIFAHQGISKEVKADGNTALFDTTMREAKLAGDKSLLFTNFVDYDMKYGHRRDVTGYAKALEEFDERLPEFEKLLQSGDIAVITADHGCDPTFKGTDHTREYIPILVFGPGIKTGSIGWRKTFSDIGQTLAKHFDLDPLEYGESFL